MKKERKLSSVALDKDALASLIAIEHKKEKETTSSWSHSDTIRYLITFYKEKS